MGRRKIEIQPITHERNRSVTFLKRKNGLFKKAYELGVLCSVDVAVIIFEERQGHNLKLYQYGSSNIHEIVQRHLRHDGEKDTRGPADFSGNAPSTKLDDVGEGDDDEDGDDDDVIMPSKRRMSDGKMKPGGGQTTASDMMGSDIDYMPRMLSHGHGSQQQSSLSLPSSMSMSGHHAGHHSQHPSSSIPISSDRLRPVHQSQSSDHQHKRPRLGIPPRSSSTDPPPSSGSGYSYPPPPMPNSQHHHQPPFRHPGSSSAYPHQPQYTPFFPTSSSSSGHGHGHATPPTPSFIPLQSDFSSSGRARGASTSSTGGGAGNFLPTRTSSSASGGAYDGIYRGGGSSGSSSAGAGGGPGDLFSFLDPDDQGRGRRPSSAQQPPSQHGPGFGLDWPVHSSSQQSQPPPPPPPPVSAPPSSGGSGPSSAGTSGPGSGGGPGGGSGADWLDFLSGNGSNNTGSGRGHAASPTGNTPATPKAGATPRGPGGHSWERAAEGGGDREGGRMVIDDMGIFTSINGDVKKEGGGVG